MSGFTLNAYRLTYGFQGSGIYSNTNTFSLNSNTIILFVFVLMSAYVISVCYYLLARIFTKVPMSSQTAVDEGIHMDYRDTPLHTWFRHSNRLFRPRLLRNRNSVPHLCLVLHTLFLLLAKAYSLRSANPSIHHG